jgi:hypothetical protein
MLRKGLLACAIAGMFMMGATAAEIVVRVAPPRAIVERRPPQPGRNYIWTAGYHRWDGRAYVWVPGAWIAPPRQRARWVAHHWQRRGHDWVFVEGHWR